MCRWTMSSAVRFALDNSGGKSQIRVEPNLIWGSYAVCGRDYNLKCTALCSINCFLFCFGGAVEVRIVICLSMLEGWRMTSRLIVTTLKKTAFGLRLFAFERSGFGLCAVLFSVVVCAGAKFSS